MVSNKASKYLWLRLEPYAAWTVKLLQLTVNEESHDWLEKVTVECPFPDTYSNTPTPGKAQETF